MSKTRVTCKIYFPWKLPTNFYTVDTWLLQKRSTGTAGVCNRQVWLYFPVFTLYRIIQLKTIYKTTRWGNDPGRNILELYHVLVQVRFDTFKMKLFI